jgi:hypothetical protein
MRRIVVIGLPIALFDDGLTHGDPYHFQDDCH